MILKYRTYPHDQGEVSIVIAKRAIETPTGIRIGHTENWSINGILHADDQAALTIALAALQAAYSTNGGDIGLYLDDGTTVTAHYINNQDTRGGVRVKDFNYPVGDGAEYSTFRSYQIQIEAEIALTLNAIKEWTESLTFTGGGPRFVMLQPLNGPPIRQLVADQTPYQVSQSGAAVGYGSPPPFPAPLFSFAEHRDRRRQTIGTPQFRNGQFTDFPISWSYEFESGTPLLGLPTTLPTL